MGLDAWRFGLPVLDMRREAIKNPCDGMMVCEFCRGFWSPGRERHRPDCLLYGTEPK